MRSMALRLPSHPLRLYSQSTQRMSSRYFEASCEIDNGLAMHAEKTVMHHELAARVTGKCDDPLHGVRRITVVKTRCSLGSAPVTACPRAVEPFPSVA